MVDPRAWYHLILTTYGAWLPGDPRGFRTRHHREHVEGDYKNPPPPGKYEKRHTRSRDSLQQPPVRLPRPLRAVAGSAVKGRLEKLGATLVCLTVSAQHVHLLAKLPPGEVRRWTGAAKRHAWYALREHGWSGKLWGKRCKIIPVKSRRQQLNVYRYILAHVEIGAWVWKWGDKT